MTSFVRTIKTDSIMTNSHMEGTSWHGVIWQVRMSCIIGGRVLDHYRCSLGGQYCRKQTEIAFTG